MMQKYQIIPRRFRPKQFAEVAGHTPIVETLKNALSSNRIGQAYLFSGSRGCGKTTLARLLAKALNCEQLTEEKEPCNSCESCTEINEGRSLDMIEIDGASNRGIDDIRQINETVGYAPSKGKHKIYIIDEVHMLTKEAFNALLKTLEEPPSQVKFFFATTEPHKIPQTIISRCQRFYLSRIPEAAISRKLSEIATALETSVEEGALTQIAKLAEGSLRDAESLLDQLICFGKTPITLEMTREAFGLLPTDDLFALDSLIEQGDIDGAIQLANTIYASGRDIHSAIDALLEHFQTHLLTQLGRAPNSPYVASPFSKGECLTFLDTLLDWQKQMQKTPFKAVHLEMLLANLVRSKNKLPLDALVDKLTELEKRLASAPIQPIEPVRPAPPPLPEEPVKKPTNLEQKSAPPPLPKGPADQSRHDTLVRFTAVELEGVVENPTGRT